MNYDDHPDGCYYYNNHLHFNKAIHINEISIRNYEKICMAIPYHCFNNVLDCPSEFGVDCGEVCHNTCQNTKPECTTTTAPTTTVITTTTTTTCKRFVEYSNSGWRFDRGGRDIKKYIVKKYTNMECKNDEFEFDQNEGKCIIDSNGQLKISIKNYPYTNDNCNYDGQPAIYNTANNCSIIYSTHPNGVRTELISDYYGIPYGYGSKYTLDTGSFRYWKDLKLSLQCSPLEEHNDWFYWEKCCFFK